MCVCIYIWFHERERESISGRTLNRNVPSGHVQLLLVWISVSRTIKQNLHIKKVFPFRKRCSDLSFNPFRVLIFHSLYYSITPPPRSKFPNCFKSCIPWFIHTEGRSTEINRRSFVPRGNLGRRFRATVPFAF